MSEHLNLTHLQKRIERQEETIKGLNITIFMQQVELDGFIKEAPERVENFMNNGYDAEETHDVNLKNFYRTFLK